MRSFKFQISSFKLPAAMLAFGIIILLPSAASACATCYGGNIDSSMADGMNWGIFTLLGVVGTVLAAFLTFLIYATRKSEALEAASKADAETVAGS